MNAAFKRSIDLKIKYRHLVSIVLEPHYTNYNSLQVKNHHLSDFAVHMSILLDDVILRHEYLKQQQLLRFPTSIGTECKKKR